MAALAAFAAFAGVDDFIAVAVAGVDDAAAGGWAVVVAAATAAAVVDDVVVAGVVAAVAAAAAIATAAELRRPCVLACFSSSCGLETNVFVLVKNRFDGTLSRFHSIPPERAE